MATLLGKYSPLEWIPMANTTRGMDLVPPPLSPPPGYQIISSPGGGGGGSLIHLAQTLKCSQLLRLNLRKQS